MGWTVVRAAGSLGAVDLVCLQPGDNGHQATARAVLTEVKETGRSTGEGEGVFYPSSSGGKGEDQWNLLRELDRDGFEAVFIVRQKGRLDHLDLDLPRFAVHRVDADVEAYPLRQTEGIPMNDYFGELGEH